MERKESNQTNKSIYMGKSTRIHRVNKHYSLPSFVGQTKLLEALGGELKIPCYGIQRTMYTPSDSIHNVAR